MDKAKTIGFIGLGMMGKGMAKNLIKAGFQVNVYNRSQEKAAPLVAEGAKLKTHPGDVLDGADIVITMISNDKALEEIVYGDGGLDAKLRQGVIHISMSTVAPATSAKFKEHHRSKGATYLAAPVSGLPDAAAAGKLWIFLAGEKSAKERARPILEFLGQKTFDFGDAAESANVYKLINNFMILSSVHAMGEAFNFAEKNGLDPKKVGEILTESVFACPIFRIYVPIISERKFEPPGFALELGAKDFRLLMQAALESLTPMPLASMLNEELIASLAKGYKRMDWSAITKLCRQDAGLEKG